MKFSILSDTSEQIISRIVKLQIDKYIVTEYYKNDVMYAQTWSVENGFSETHPFAYKPNNMCFDYYDDVSFLESKSNSNYNNFYDIIPKPKFITNWRDFDKLDNVLCVYLVMDGCIYKINSPDPIPLWRHKDYISGFTNKDYNLKEVKSILQTKPWVRNIEIIDIPYYNQYEGRTKAVEFDYKLPSKKHLRTELQKEKIFENHYFI